MNFIAAKGNLKPQQDVQQAMQEWANFLAQNKTNEVTQQAEQKDPLRETINEIVLKKLSAPIEMPKYTTLQDVFNAQKGDKLNTFGEYLSTSPDAVRLIGSFLGGTYIDRNGKFVHSGEKEAQERIAQMEKAQQQALEAEKQQGTLAGNMYDALNKMDIADMNDKRARELAEQQEKWARERFAQEMALKQLQLNSQISHQRAMEGIARDRLNNSSRGSSGGGIITGGASGINGLTEKQLKTLVKINGKSYLIPGATTSDKIKIGANNSIIKSLDDGLKVIKNNPNAFGVKGAVHPAVQSILMTKAGTLARSQIGGLAQEYKKYLTGVASNQTEAKDFLRYVPAPFDNAKTLEGKIEAIKNIAKSKNEGILNTYYYVDLDGENSDPLGLGL